MTICTLLYLTFHTQVLCLFKFSFVCFLMFSVFYVLFYYLFCCHPVFRYFLGLVIVSNFLRFLDFFRVFSFPFSSAFTWSIFHFFSLISWLFLCAWYPLLYIFWFILVAFTQTKISRSQLFILANHTYILLAFSTLITLTSLCNFSSSDYKVQRVSSVCQLVYNLLVSAWL